jgi:CBS domain-containing protein
MNAASIMTPNVVTAAPGDSVEQLAKTMLERRISALPVVGGDGKILGIVSEGDLMRRPEAETERHPSWWLTLLQGSTDRAADYVKSHGQTAEQVMTRDVITVAPETSVAEIAETLERNHIKRVPVVSGGNIVGIVSRANLLHAVAAHKGNLPGAAHSDTEIRESVFATFRREGLPGEDYVNPIVVDGVVHLWGAVEAPEQRDALKLAAESVDGVKGIEMHVGIFDHLTRAVMWAE